MALEIVENPTFHAIGEIFHFLSAEFPFSECGISILLSAEFPFSERRILGSLSRAPFEFLRRKFEFSEPKISIFTTEFALY